ncbi:MAG: hypothetical protein AB2L24_04510 [Mangrovibacterium sp.]
MKIFFLISFLLLLNNPGSARIPDADYTVEKIWDAAPHNAFTDLIKFRNKYYCTFREGTGHIPAEDGTGDGGIRILVSKDGKKWESLSLITKKGYDLRDPKLSITPNNRLMILMGGSVYDKGELVSRLSYVAFMDKNEVISEMIPVNIDSSVSTYRDWLWRVRWHKNTGYGTVFQFLPEQEWQLYLVKTTDGINYQLVSKLDITGKPNESAIEILKSGMMRIVVRREEGPGNGYAGYSQYPYTDWKWDDLGIRLGGPNLITLPDRKTILGTRSYYGTIYHTALFELTGQNKAEKLIEFPSEKDTGYPGIIFNRNELWISYNSGHEGKTSIYLAKIKNIKKLLCDFPQSD